MADSSNFMKVAPTESVAEGKPFCAKVNDTALALFKVKGKYFAIDNKCPHAGGPLCEGNAEEGVVTCPWHASKFKVETGEVVQGPAKSSVKTYAVQVRGSDIYVDVGVGAETEKTVAPKPISLSFTPEFDKERPFTNESFVKKLMEGLQFPFKLYGQLPFVPISQSADEMDLYLGEIHLTEMDIKKISALMSLMNDTLKTEITYCLFHSSQFPGAMLLNIRGAKAPMNLKSDIRY